MIPLDHLIPPDSRVEIDAKIAAGYFSSNKQLTEADLFKTVGRTWEETEHWAREWLLSCIEFQVSLLNCNTTPTSLCIIAESFPYLYGVDRH